MRRNKKQEYAILWLHSQNTKPSEIADELNIPIDKVESAIRINSEPVQTKKSSKSKDLMINKTSSKGSKSVAIMTGEASALNDELKKKQHTKVKDTQEYIHKPNE
jgi:hypothetical protein